MVPDFLIEKLQKQYGEKTTNKIIEGYGVKRPVTFRVNTLKSSAQEVKDVLDKLSATIILQDYLDANSGKL